MLIKDSRKLDGFIASDASLIREIIHPKNDRTSPGISLALAELLPGQATKPHYLKPLVEIYYILDGQGVMHIEEETTDVFPGQAVYIPPGQVQFIENPGPEKLRFLCICHPGYDPEFDFPE